MVLFTQIQEISQILPQLLATTTSISVKDPKSPQLLSLVYGDFVALSPVANPDALYPPHIKAVLARIHCEPIPIITNQLNKTITKPKQ